MTCRQLLMKHYINRFVIEGAMPGTVDFKILADIPSQPLDFDVSNVSR